MNLPEQDLEAKLQLIRKMNSDGYSRAVISEKLDLPESLINAYLDYKGNDKTETDVIDNANKPYVKLLFNGVDPVVIPPGGARVDFNHNAFKKNE